MATSLTLHVGLPRSGTRHVQEVLSRGRRALAAQGWLYPGAEYLPRNGLNQQALGYSLVGSSLGWLDAEAQARAARHAEVVYAELAAHPGHALLSADSLAHLDAPAARHLLDLLDVRPDSVRVVVTARDLGGLLPALWHGAVEDGATDHYEPYLAALLDRRSADGAPWRRALDLPALVARWSGVVGPERVRLVTVPQCGAETGLLWSRFAEAAGLPDRPPSPLAPAPARQDSDAPLGAAQVQLLRTVNAVMLDDGLPPDVRRAVRHRLVESWRAAPATGPWLTVPGRFRRAVQEWSLEDVARLQALGVRVTGPPADLQPLFGPFPGSSLIPVGEPLARRVLAELSREPQGSPRRLPRVLAAVTRPLRGRRTATGFRLPRLDDARARSARPGDVQRDGARRDGAQRDGARPQAAGTAPAPTEERAATGRTPAETGAVHRLPIPRTGAASHS